MLESHKLDNIKYLAGKESDVETIKPNSVFANYQLTVFMKALIQIKYLKWSQLISARLFVCLTQRKFSVIRSFILHGLWLCAFPLLYTVIIMCVRNLKGWLSIRVKKFLYA